ncbi:hypothetical protein HAX54_023394 [Datura stramonium]|uniref:Uncharacterized protein n=1 Tax=Datura stramonium TaxID=4076 RepID=A0ABS8UYF3_DATST|nr:hypothetical protein [Datura stramonium]
MAEASNSGQLNGEVAVVNGSNKGIGFEICKLLASKGMVVILTARDEKKGAEAIRMIKEDTRGLSNTMSSFITLMKILPIEKIKVATQTCDAAEECYVKTDICCDCGTLSVEQGAEGPVWLALLPHGGPSGNYYFRKELSPF